MTDLCKESGLVTGFDKEGRALVTIRRVEACFTCAAKGACQTLGGKTEDVVIPVENTLGVKAGDLVVLGLPELSLIKASVAVYLIPAAGLTAGALICAKVAGPGGGDGVALIGALGGLVLGFLISRLITRRMARDPRYQPTLVQRLES